MLTPWLEVDGVAAHLAELGAAAGLDLIEYGTVADADTIRDTAIAQPLIVAMSLATSRAVFGADRTAAEVLGTQGLVGGHSVGEFTSIALAGVIPEVVAMRLVALRGAAMSAVAREVETGMSAVLGGDPEEVNKAIAALGLVAANVNGAGQVVAAGELSALAELTANPPAKARVMSLSVAGAFHTSFMAPAQNVLANETASVEVTDPTVGLLSNADGAVLSTGMVALQRLVTQITSPVRWDLCQATIGERGATGLLELAPAGVLTGLARRTLQGVETFALKSPDQLDAAREFVAKHTENFGANA